MNLFVIRCLNKGRAIYTQEGGSAFPTHLKTVKAFDYEGQAASDQVKSLISAPGPCMVSRLGHNELQAISVYLTIHNDRRYLDKFYDYLTGRSGWFWWDKSLINAMQIGAGFFPATPDLLSKFCIKMLDDIALIDLLGAWLPGESFLTELQQAIRVPLIDLEPYVHANPWSAALANRTVLVIHPFVESIRSQFSRRHLLFKDQRILPEFELKTIKVIQSHAGDKVNFPSWFDAFEYMCKKNDQTNFDIALIGAGAYGLPLAVHIKRIGKKAIYLGGATQILFGIRGSRWDDRPFYQTLFNPYWVRPQSCERPQNADLVERACYW
uniref:Uncharacterized protein n=1 Tax=Cyanothece sp. (strain PCC 7425 / ATCC 29141) TaxID=395961 RepID=B8HLJ8_CYAP4